MHLSLSSYSQENSFAFINQHQYSFEDVTVTCVI